MVREPEVTRIPDLEAPNRVGRYRIVGGSLAAGWKARDGREAWCEITVYQHGDELTLGSFGGEVWPAAWPALFVVGPRTIHGQTTKVTERGAELLRLADEALGLG